MAEVHCQWVAEMSVFNWLGCSEHLLIPDLFSLKRAEFTSVYIAIESEKLAESLGDRGHFACHAWYITY